MAVSRSPPTWSYENPHYFYNRDFFNNSYGIKHYFYNRDFFNNAYGIKQFKLHRFPGMVSLFCTVKCPNATFVKTLKKPAYDNTITIKEPWNKLSREDLVKKATYVSLLQDCANKRDLTRGQQFHSHVIKSGYEGNSSIGNKLVFMYVKCGSLNGARQVFDKLSQRNALSWSVVVGAYARCRLWEEVLVLLCQMQGQGVRLDNIIVPSLLKACAGLAALEQGKQIHGCVLRRGFELDIVVENALVDMYAKCGHLEYARQVFDKMAMKDVVSWTAIIGGYAQIGDSGEALSLHSEMELSGVKPDAITWNAMNAGFAQNGKGDEALELLHRMKLSGLEPDVNSWNAIITGCAQNGYSFEALEAFCQMQLANVKPNTLTISGILPACADIGALWQGIQIHSYLIKSGFESNVFVGSALVDMYSKCMNIDDALKAFDGIPKKNAVLWNAMIAAYAQHGHPDQALEFFHQMKSTGMKPDVITWNAIITGYAKKGQGYKALELFFQMHLAGIKPTVISWNALIAGSVQSGHGEEALKLFHQMQLGGITSDLELWNAVIAGFSQDGHNKEALKQFSRLKIARIKPNPVTIASVLSACAGLMALQHGKEAHGYILRNGFDSNVFVGSSLVDMYSKCKRIEASQRVFDILSQRNVVSWNVMIAGYAHNGNGDDALELFRQMQEAGLKPDSTTIVTVLSICSNLMALQEGKQVHGYITRQAMDSDVFVRSALIDMYAKCGSITDAQNAFDQTHQRDVAVWNAVIAGYAMHGLGENAITLFHQMQQLGIKPDHVTFTAILSACSRSGMVSEGWQYFNLLSQDYGVKPRIEDYTCLVNLLGSAGNLDKAYELLNSMPFEPDACVWGALLRACRLHNNSELGECAAKQLFELEPENVVNYVLLSNIYAAVGRWDDVGKVRNMIKARGLKTRPGCSWIKVKNKVHAFLVGDNSHPELEKLYAKLDDLARQMEVEGFVSEIHFMQQDFDEKDYIFCGHSEKLAIAFGLINTSSWTPIRIVKNLRMCVDCHTTTKIISRITEKEIHVRDTGCFHYFMDGVCSCRDSW